jgi:dipeptidyl aminopeptidase/acylaminoacyl peptidase
VLVHRLAKLRQQFSQEKGISTMNKMQRQIAVIVGSTSCNGIDILLSVIPISRQCGRSRIFLSLALLPLSLIMHAQTVKPAKRFSFADLQHLQSVGDVQISPNGQSIVYSVHQIDIRQDRSNQTFWLVRLSGARVPVALPHVIAPSWSPDGQILAVVNRSSGGSTVQLLRADTLEVVRTFAIPAPTENLVWSPDSKSLAFTLFVPEANASSFLQQAVDTAESDLTKPTGAQWAAPVQITQSAHYREDGGEWLHNRRGHRHLFVLSTVNGVVRQVGSEPFDDGDPAWLPDGKTLLFTSDRRPGSEQMYPALAIYMTDMQGHATRLTKGNDSFHTPKPSPNGQRIAYIKTPSRPVNYTRSDLYVMHANGTEPHQLAAALDRDLSAIAWAADARGVYAKFADHGISHVGLFNLDGDSKTVASGIGGSFSTSHTGIIAYSGESATGPNELMLQDHEEATQTITSLNQFLKQRQLGTLLHLDSRSSADGTSVEGWALLPPGATASNKLPMILSLHGGPFGDDGPNWSSEYQLFAAAGYVVIYGNYRGSISYGSAFSEPANHGFPGVAYDDAMSLVDEGIRQGFVDPHRLFVTGSSAGGELTAWITGKTGRFRAAAAEKPVINQMSESLTSDQYLASPLVYEGNPWDREKELWAQSPLSLVGSVTTPTLFIAGGQDFRTPIGETLQMYDALQLRGIPTALLRAPDSGHGNLRTRPSESTAIIAATLAWFHMYDKT